MGLGSLVLGVAGQLLSWLPVAGLVLGVSAVATGVAARRCGDVTIAGIVPGIVATVIGAAISIWMLSMVISHQMCIGHAVHSEYSRCA
ncbi:hypothetical protein A4G29_12005 [Mycobacterium kansasii]|nr:hypothetical protein A4G29_12005 [Mycobacterium kansasii]